MDMADLSSWHSHYPYIMFLNHLCQCNVSLSCCEEEPCHQRVQLCPAMSSHLDWSPLPLAPPKHEDTAKAYRKRPKTWYLMASVMRIAATGRAMSFFSFAFLDTGFKAFLSRRCSESRLGELWTMAHSSYSLGPGWSTRVERLDMSGIFNGHTRSQPEFPKLFT